MKQKLMKIMQNNYELMRLGSIKISKLGCSLPQRIKMDKSQGHNFSNW